MSMDTALIRQRFSAAAASYEAEALAQRHIADRLWTLAAPRVAPKAAVLEIGAGTGLLTRRIIEARPSRLVLNDLYISPQLRQIMDAHPGVVSCREGNAESLRFEGVFDAVLSASTVQWFDDLPLFLARCARFLPAGGLLAFSSFLPGNLHEVAELTGVGLAYCEVSALQGYLAPHFDLQVLEQGEVTLHFDSPRDVLLHLRHTGVTGIRSVVWGKSRYEAFVKSYHARYADGQGVRLTYRPVYVIAASRGLLGPRP